MNRRYSSNRNDTGITVTYTFTNPLTDEDEEFEYEVPLHELIEEIRVHFRDKYGVILEGQDNRIWNLLVSLGEDIDTDIIERIVEDDEVSAELKDTLEDEARAEYEEICEDEEED